MYQVRERERGRRERGGERREGGLTIQSEVQYVYVYQVREREGREGGGRRIDTVRGFCGIY